MALPISWGYGFCIGGVAATDPQEGGVISPGGVGYDINCGVRLVRTDIPAEDCRPRMKKLVDTLFSTVPCGVGGTGKIKFTRSEMKELVVEGAPYVVKRGYGTDEDIERTEAGGQLEGARPGFVSDHAYERGTTRLAARRGNHFLEVQIVDEMWIRTRRVLG